MIVPGGGIAPRRPSVGRAAGPSFFLPVRVLSRLFRRLFLEKLAAAHAAGRLAVLRRARAVAPTTKAFAAILAPLRKTNWFVYAKPPFAGPEAVLAYLARYTHRVAISNSRLVALDANGVTFTLQGLPAGTGRCDTRTMTLAPDEFIRRFLLHVLPKGFHRIRHYGLLASAGRKAEHRTRQGADRRPEPRAAPAATTEATADGAARPSSAMPLLRRPHDHHRDLRARRRPARPASVRRDQDRGRMTRNRAWRQPMPPERRPRRLQPRLHPRPIDRWPRPANRTDLDRPGRARPHQGLAWRDRVANSARAPPSMRRPAPPSTVGSRQIPIDPKDLDRSPAGSFPGGFRTPAPGVWWLRTTGRHPKPFTGTAFQATWPPCLLLRVKLPKPRESGYRRP